MNSTARILPASADYANDSVAAETAARGLKLNLASYMLRARGAWQHNVRVYRQLIAREHFDLVIGDETYEIQIARRLQRGLRRPPFVMIYDFVGADAMTRNPLEQLGLYLMNLFWSQERRMPGDLLLFIGELETLITRPWPRLSMPGKTARVQ